MRYVTIALLLQLSLLFAQDNRGINPIGQDIPEIGAGKYYALLIAVEDYKYIKKLDFPVKDATALRKVLGESYNFRRNDITFLKNPDRTAILKSFARLQKKLTSKDNLLIFYAGHGFYNESIGQGYWLPANADWESLAEWISNSDIRDQISAIRSKHTLLISDACFSGGIFNTRLARAPNRVVRQLYQLPSRRAISSGTLNEVPDKSVFAKYLLERLQSNQDAYISAEKLFSLFKEAVIYNSPIEQVPQYGVVQQAGDEGGDFIFVRAGTPSVSVTSKPPARTETRPETRNTMLNSEPPVKIETQPETGNEMPITTNNSRRIAEFRSTPLSNLESVTEIVKRLGFYDKNRNPSGKGFANDFEMKTLQGKKVVVDHASGLMWQQSGSDNSISYVKAADYIKQLNQERFAGYSDWRLPTLEEAMSLLEPEKKNDGYIDPVFDAKSKWIWTSDQSRASRAWGVVFAYGYCNVVGIGNINYVRAVRSGQSSQ